MTRQAICQQRFGEVCLSQPLDASLNCRYLVDGRLDGRDLVDRYLDGGDLSYRRGKRRGKLSETDCAFELSE